MLKGKDALNKANRLMESMSTSNKKTTFSNVEDVFLAYDGKHYGIVREGQYYVLKSSDSVNPMIAEDFDYINGLQNKPKYTRKSINEVQKLYNLMNIQFRNLHGDKMLNETIQEKKYVLGVKKKSNLK